MKKNIELKYSSFVIFFVNYFICIIFLLERILINIKGAGTADFLSIFFGQFFFYLFSGCLIWINEIRQVKNYYLKHIVSLIIIINFILIVVDQVFFKILGVPLNFSFSEGIALTDFRLFIDSGLSELNGPLSICLFLLIGGLIFILRSIYSSSHNKKIKIKILPIFIFFLISIPISMSDHKSGIEQYPLVRIFTNIKVTEEPQQNFKNIDYKHEEIKSLIYGKQKVTRLKVENLYQSIRRSTKKNIILFIVESVGSIQIAENGQINKEITPYLYSLKDNIILFNNIYNVFPGTTRSHIPITTGGRTITWSSVNRELLHSYSGVTTAKFFNSKDYQTALFSGMNLGFENLNFFYKGLGFNHIFDPDDESSDFNMKYKVHSWGIDEQIVFTKALDWLGNQSKPAFMQILTNTTHHPYGIPTDFKSKLPGNTKYQRYLQALNYTDRRLGEFISSLKVMGKLKNTLIFITGDHGQAFARRHENNWTHKNFLYEENIKNFLMIIDPNKKSKYVLSNKRGSIGDILPTITHFVSDEGIDVIGENLFSPQYQQKLIFFHKNSHPELWGLIDGDYKFIAPRMNESKSEFFDLLKDPKETSNIIDDHQEKISTYTRKIKSWYLKLNNEFTSNLKDYDIHPVMNIDDLVSFGPKQIHFGVNLFGEEFKSLEEINPYEDMSVWTQGISYPKDTIIKYEFISPNGSKKIINFKYKKGWSSVKVFHHSKTPMAEGIWKLNLYLGNSQKVLLSKEFLVNYKAPLNIDLFSTKGKIHYISFGSRKSDNKFIKLKQINPNEKMEVQLLLSSYRKKTKLLFNWIGPSGKKRQFGFHMKKGWTKAWVYHSPKKLMEEGNWELIITDTENNELVKKTFEVHRDALLLVPAKY